MLSRLHIPLFFLGLGLLTAVAFDLVRDKVFVDSKGRPLAGRLRRSQCARCFAFVEIQSPDHGGRCEACGFSWHIEYLPGQSPRAVFHQPVEPIQPEQLDSESMNPISVPTGESRL